MVNKLSSMLVLAVLTSQTLSAGVFVPRQGQIPVTIYQTTKDKAIHEVLNTPFTVHDYADPYLMDLDKAVATHEYFGVGASLTDASAWLLSQMPEGRRKEFIREVFTKDGANLSMIRLNCGASDYSTELYNYNDNVGDVKMKKFSVERDELYLIPTILQIKEANPDLFIYSSIWSCPGWMKDSGRMCAGSLLDTHIPSFANYWTAYLKAYKEHGIRVDAITVQNEPTINDQYPTCRLSAKQEAELAGRQLPESFRKAGLDTKIWIHDDNMDQFDRVLEMLMDQDVCDNIDAVAWHPYGGKPSVLKTVRTLHPGIDFHLTERGTNLEAADKQTIQWLSNLVFDAIRCGCASYSSWNLLLTPDGQPNTGRFPCGGLLSYDPETDTLTPSLLYTVFRHLAPYVERGAKVLDVGKRDRELESITLKNPDGSYVVVVTNGSGKRHHFQIKYKDQYLQVVTPTGSWSVTTVVIGK